MAAKATPADRARARRNPAVLAPPKPSDSERREGLRRTRWMVAGRPILVGPAIEGDPSIESTTDSATTIVQTVRDPRGKLLGLLGDESMLLESGVSMTLDGVVYMLRDARETDGTGAVQATFEDAVKWRMSRHRRYVAMRRTEAQTFLRFAERLVLEAQVPPLAPFGFFCPQLYDRLDIPAARRQRAAQKAGQPGRKKGVGASSAYTVKGQPANGRQLETIDGVLDAGGERKAGRRVLVGAVMTITQESVAGMLMVSSSGQHHGAFHQDASYGTVGQRRDPAHAMNRFLDRWKERNGSIKTVRGSIAEAIERVQVSGDASAYAQWQAEAERTVSEWEGSGGAAATGVEVEEPDSFTRGEKHGEPETSWDALGRYAQPRNFRRWAFGNTLYVVSDDELRAAAPSIEVDGSEPWLRARPGWEWAPQRPIAEMSLQVLASSWGVQPGAVVRGAFGDARDGRWLVSGWSGAMVSPELEVTVRRPQDRAAEPPRGLQTVQIGASGLSAEGGNATDVARAISGRGYPYVWGGGHAHAGTPDRGDGSDPGIGYDCSGATAAFLAALGMGFKPGDPVPASGWFASSWGVPGEGRVFTVWAHSTHVWVEFADGSRLDTSQHPGSGPRYVTDRRSTAGFTPRHWRSGG